MERLYETSKEELPSTRLVVAVRRSIAATWIDATVFSKTRSKVTDPKAQARSEPGGKRVVSFGVAGDQHRLSRLLSCSQSKLSGYWKVDGSNC
jgi:hypothetical protein